MQLKVFTAFSGYDSQCMALDRLGVDYDLVGWSEIDKYAIQAHNAVYPQYRDRNFGDICHIDWDKVPDFDLFTYSFPCTDISTAGKQAGLEKGSGTRSSLLWECEKAIENKMPKYLLMENVKALVSKKFINHFNEWVSYLQSIGYSNFWKLINAKDYGVPQNRERVFMISILGVNEYYEFPRTFKLKKRLKDVLENNIEDYYMKHPANKWILSDKAKRTLKMRYASIDSDIAICVTARGFISWNCTYVTRKDGNITILTNKEVFRLMGISDYDIERIQASGISYSHQYYMAGNSIVVDVLFYIFKNLFIERKQKKYIQLKLF
jgi:DNA (cytosine-5)-methyltransferase 1